MRSLIDNFSKCTYFVTCIEWTSLLSKELEMLVCFSRLYVLCKYSIEISSVWIMYTLMVIKCVKRFFTILFCCAVSLFQWCTVLIICCVNRGRTGVFVCGLLPNSAAMDCGRIGIGDQIIEVNGIDMRQATVDEAADIMVRKYKIRLYFMRTLTLQYMVHHTCALYNTMISLLVMHI